MKKRKRWQKLKNMDFDNRELQQLIPHYECLPVNWSSMCAYFTEKTNKQTNKKNPKHGKAVYTTQNSYVFFQSALTGNFCVL